jgi:hypothetical protein
MDKFDKNLSSFALVNLPLEIACLPSPAFGRQGKASDFRDKVQENF